MRHSTISLHSRHIEPSSKSIASQVSQSRNLFPRTCIRIADLSLKKDRILHQITGNKSAAIQKISREAIEIPIRYHCAQQDITRLRDVFVLNGVVCHVT